MIHATGIDIDVRCGTDAEIGPWTEETISQIATMFAARLVGDPIPKDGDAVILRGYSSYRKEPSVYLGGHLEESGRDKPDELSFCTQPMEPHVFGRLRSGSDSMLGKCQASGGYWGAVKKSALKHVGTVKKWFWTWGEWGPRGGGGVHFCLTVNQWEYRDDERIY